MKEKPIMTKQEVLALQKSIRTRQYKNLNEVFNDKNINLLTENY